MTDDEAAELYSMILDVGPRASFTGSKLDTAIKRGREQVPSLTAEMSVVEWISRFSIGSEEVSSRPTRQAKKRAKNNAHPISSSCVIAKMLRDNKVTAAAFLRIARSFAHQFFPDDEEEVMKEIGSDPRHHQLVNDRMMGKVQNAAMKDNNALALFR